MVQKKQGVVTGIHEHGCGAVIVVIGVGEAAENLWSLVEGWPLVAAATQEGAERINFLLFLFYLPSSSYLAFQMV